MSRAKRKSTDTLSIGEIYAEMIDDAIRKKLSRADGLSVGRKWSALKQKALAAQMRTQLRIMAARLFLDHPRWRVKEVERSILKKIKDDSAFVGKNEKTISPETVSQAIKGVKTGVNSGADPLSYL